jgi:hypothetical protein
MNQAIAQSLTFLCFFSSGFAHFDGEQVLPPLLKSPTLYGCQDVQVDRFFQQHFTSIAQALQKREKLTGADSQFVYVICCLSGANTTVEFYSGIPLLKPADLEAYRLWYDQHWVQICWSQITQIQELLAAPTLSEEQLVQLESFIIE